MSDWNALAHWFYGDARKDEGFWYSDPLLEAHGLTDNELFWVPYENALCILWHVGHIAHREQCHFVDLMQGNEHEDIPAGYEVFGTEWCSVEQLKESIDSTDNVFEWVESVRQASGQYISSLTEEQFHSTPKSACGLSVGHWIFITAAHAALHVGKIQLLRNMLKGIRDNPC
jgi:hypothetical protein